MRVHSGYDQITLSAEVVLCLGQHRFVVSADHACLIADLLKQAADTAILGAAARRAECEEKGLEPARAALLDLAAGELNIAEGEVLATIALQSRPEVVSRVLDAKLRGQFVTGD